MTTAAEIARTARAALRTAFPGSKISVTSNRYSITVRWTDDGPTVAQVDNALLAARCAEARKNSRGGRYLVIPENSFGLYWFDRYNAAERAAAIKTRAKIDFIKALAREKRRPEQIAFISGMPLGFVNTVLREDEAVIS